MVLHRYHELMNLVATILAAAGSGVGFIKMPQCDALPGRAASPQKQYEGSGLSFEATSQPCVGEPFGGAGRKQRENFKLIRADVSLLVCNTQRKICHVRLILPFLALPITIMN